MLAYLCWLGVAAYTSWVVDSWAVPWIPEISDDEWWAMMSVWFRVWGWGQRLFHSIRVDAGSQKKTFLNVIQIYCNCEGREPRWGVLTPLSYDFFSFSAASMRRASSICIMADSFLFWQVLVHVGFLPLIVGLFFSAHHRWVVDDFHLGAAKDEMFLRLLDVCSSCILLQ